MKIDKQEQEILESLERGEWKSVKNLKEEIKKARAQAVATAKKDARMNLSAQPSRYDCTEVKQVVEKVVFHRLVKIIQMQGARNHEE